MNHRQQNKAYLRNALKALLCKRITREEYGLCMTGTMRISGGQIWVKRGKFAGASVRNMLRNGQSLWELHCTLRRGIGLATRSFQTLQRISRALPSSY